MNADALFRSMEWLGIGLLCWWLLALVLGLPGIITHHFFSAENPQLRSRVLRLTLIGILILPLAVFVPSFDFQARKASGVELNPQVRETPAVSWEKVAVWRPVLFQIVEQDRTFSLENNGKADFSWKKLLAWVPLIFGLAALTGLVRLIRAVWAARNRVCRAERAAESLGRGCSRIAAELGLRPPGILVSKEIKSPMVSGIFQPVILLPEGLDACDAVWQHELTHIRRHDVFWQFLATVLAFLMPLQPGFAWLRRAMNATDEEVCDDSVLLQGSDRHNYARLLVKVAEEGGSCTVASLPMARQSMLEQRVKRILDVSWIPVAKVPPGRLLLAFLAVSLVIAAAGFVYADVQKTLEGTKSGEIPEARVDKVVPPSGRLPLIRELEVEYTGKSTVSKEEIIQKSGLKLNEEYHVNRIRQAIKSLYATRQFANLRIYDEPLKNGVKVVILVQPSPIVENILWEGLEKDRQPALQALIRTREGRRLSKLDLFQDAGVLREQLGEAKAVSAEIINIVEQKGTADVVFRIR